MKNYIWFKWSLITISLAIIGILVGCAHKQAYKKALELDHPTKEDIKKKLHEITD